MAFRRIPNGIPGIETRMALLWSEGVIAERMTPHRFVELTATGPAKAYGLHPRKGTIAIGADADLVVWDERDFVLRNGMLHHEVDYTPYEGMRLSVLNLPGLFCSSVGTRRCRGGCGTPLDVRERVTEFAVVVRYPSKQ